MVTIDEIAAFLAETGELRYLASDGPGFEVLRPAPIDDAGPGDISFCGVSAAGHRVLLGRTAASLLLLDRAIDADEAALRARGVKAVFRTDSARLSFVRVVEQFFAPGRPVGVHPSAVVDSTAEVAPDVHIGPLSTIGAGVVIGAGTTIHAGVHLYPGVRLGRNVVVHSGCVIGSDGFGFERDAAGRAIKFPHLGGVVIEDDVEVFALTHIARGTLRDTVIKRGAKVDALCHLSHNVEVGEDAFVIANAMIGGSVKIGARSWIGPSTSVIDRVALGDDVFSGMASVVTKPLGAGTRVAGAPAKELAEYKVLLGKLRELSRSGEGP